jgi:hypothetical protein
LNIELEDFKNLDKRGQLIKSEGPGPFITKQIFRLAGGKTIAWQSRHHRKGIAETILHDAESFGAAFWRGFSQPDQLNWWIAVVFSIGSALFMLGSLLGMLPGMAKYFGLDNAQVNAVFFLGSIPFTTAAFLQFYQATTTTDVVYNDENEKFRLSRFGKYISSVAWLSAGLQFIGTILFNVNTFNGMNSKLDWLQSDFRVWGPDIVGSMFFLVSGYLAFIEVAHSFWKSDTKNISWWVVFINLLGCVAFIISAFFAFVPASGATDFEMFAALLFTFIGAVCFLLGSLLMLPEMGFEDDNAE